MNEKLILIDGNSILNRAYFALPPLNDKEGRNVNAVYGFVNILLKVLDEYKPTRLVVTFDKRGDNFRKHIYTEYKANRKGMPDDLAAQMPVLHQLLQLTGVCIAEKAGVEADDIIGTLTRRFKVPSYIVSGDRDLLQLVDADTTVLLTKKGITEVETVTPQVLAEAYRLTPPQVIEYKALRGDTSDNIPGVKGVGEKTATDLIAKYGDIDNLYAHIDEQKGALKEKLLADREMAYVSRKLATIVTDVDISCDLADCNLPRFTAESREFMQNLQFRSLLSRIRFEDADEKKVRFVAETEEIATAARLQEVVGHFSDRPVALYLENDKVFLAEEEKRQYVVPFADSFLDELTEGAVLDILRPFLCSDAPKILFDGKRLAHWLDARGIALCGVTSDVGLMQYLTEYRAYKTAEELFAAYNMEKGAAALVALDKILREKLADHGTEKLYSEVELPLSSLLFEMEKEGVAVDERALDALSAQFKGEIEEVSEKIYALAGERFNISSPKQLGAVLFDKLQLKHFKKTATGYSTNNDVLEKLKGAHPIVEEIIQYRKITKLYGTYVEGLRPFIRHGVVHTQYNQFLTTTGRLSSSDPNLQNIPIRNEQGREIRKLFRSKYGVFVGADYSQIELRLLAAFSRDENLLAAFERGDDIHRLVASELLNIPQELVNDDMRRMAKAVNFGIIYGISGFGLSENVGISVKKAQQYIGAYFTRFPKIKNYLDTSVREAREKGYVTTITGRRRYIPEINSSNFNLRSFGERAAMNMPLQGSAADIMKIAMLKADAALKRDGLKSRPVLQIHDELIVDCYPEEAARVKEILKREMENALDVGCRLTVDTEEGQTLYDA